MRSVTSSFNRTIYHKNITRFWPLWTLYTLIYAFMMPLQVLVQYDRGVAGALQEDIRQLLWENLRHMPEMCTWLACGFGLFVAMAVFSYLYSSRSACMVHALPISRKSLYFTNYISGLSMLLIPNLVIAGLTISAATCRGVFEPLPTLIWLFCQCVACLFFFSFASFCAMFTGNLLALPVFYGVLNFLVVGVGGLLLPLLSSLLYGFTNYSSRVYEGAMWATPFIKFVEQDVVSRTRVSGVENFTYAIQMDGLIVYPIYLVAGLVIALLGYLVYQARETERAGDVVAEVRVHSLFRCGVGFCGGLAMGTVTTALLGISLHNSMVLMTWSVIWGIIAYFVAEMLLQKSFKVIRRGWKRACMFGVAMVLVFVGIAFDAVGFGKYIPAKDDIRGAYIYVRGVNGSRSVDTTDPALIEKTLALHQVIKETGRRPLSTIETKDERDGNMRVNYELDNGDMVSRDYDVMLNLDELDVAGSVTNAYNTVLQDETMRIQNAGMDLPDDARITNATLSGLWDVQMQDTDRVDIEVEHLELLAQAVKQDFAEGHWGQSFLFDDAEYQQFADREFYGELNMEWVYTHDPAREQLNEMGEAVQSTAYMAPVYDMSEAERMYSGIWMTLNEDCVHTIAVLTECGYVDDLHQLKTSNEMHTNLQMAEEKVYLEDMELYQ